MSVQANATQGTLLMQGTSPDHEGIKGQVKLVTLAKIVTNDGLLKQQNNKLVVWSASEVVILVSLATNFVNYADISANALERAEKIMQKAEYTFTQSDGAYTQARGKHIQFYQQYFQRVTLTLGTNSFADEPTDLRIREFANRHDPALVSLYFQFGRYLLISSSQPGTQAANLQGIWNPLS
jgi:alpha-L-fucosidase 2